MNTGPTDAEHYRDRQRQEWDRVAAGWEKWWRTIEDGAQHVNVRLVDLAGVAPSKRVLDIATGIGEPALSAASRVGSAGAGCRYRHLKADARYRPNQSKYSGSDECRVSRSRCGTVGFPCPQLRCHSLSLGNNVAAGLFESAAQDKANADTQWFVCHFGLG